VRIIDIANYIIENNPDCCMAYNYKGYTFTESDEDMLTEECVKFFLYEQLDICGCGSPWDTAKVIRDFLTILNKYEIINRENKDSKNFDHRKLYDEKWLEINSLCGIHITENDNYYGLIQFLMYVLDTKGFLEHGSGIGGAWMTDEGRMLLYVLSKYNLEEL
jgi:hypothetical protein